MNALHGLRGVAALLIVAFHIKGVLEPQIPLSAWTGLLHNSYLWVELFFVLSGYTLARVYAQRWQGPLRSAEYFEFLRRRLARIYPLHLLLLAAMVVAIFALGLPFEKKFSWPALVSNLTLVQAWGIHARLTWNLPAWALSALFAAYLIFPFAHKALRASGSAIHALAAATCAGIVTALYLHKGNLDITYDWGAVLCVAEFTFGMLLYQISALRKLAPRLSATLPQCVILLALIWALHVGANDLLITVNMAALILCLSEDRGLLARSLASAPMVWLGQMSFAIYLVHYPLGRAFKDRVLPIEWLFGADTWMGAVSHFLEAMIAFIVAAWLLNRFLEAPLRERVR